MQTFPRQRWLSFVALGLALASPSVLRAEPWISPGDVALRHDLQRLSDAGLLSGPTISWPIGWSQVARELAKLDTATLSGSQVAAVERLRARATREMRFDQVALSARVSGAYEPDQLRTFEDTPREEGELTASADWLGETFAWKLSGTVVADADDDQTFRADGSITSRRASQLDAFRRLPRSLVGTGLAGQPDPLEQRPAHPCAFCHEIDEPGSVALEDKRFATLLAASPLFKAGGDDALADH